MVDQSVYGFIIKLTPEQRKIMMDESGVHTSTVTRAMHQTTHGNPNYYYLRRRALEFEVKKIKQIELTE